MQAKKALAKKSRAARSAKTPKSYHNYIGGKWVPGSGDWLENSNPADTRDIIGRFPLSTAKDVDPNGLAADLPEPVRVVTGEVITRINRVPVTTLAEFQRVLDSLKPGDPVVLNLSRYDRRGERAGIIQRIVQFTYQ